MFARPCPPSHDREDENPGYNKVENESSPHIAGMNSCKNHQPIKWESSRTL